MIYSQANSLVYCYTFFYFSCCKTILYRIVSPKICTVLRFLGRQKALYESEDLFILFSAKYLLGMKAWMRLNRGGGPGAPKILGNTKTSQF